MGADTVHKRLKQTTFAEVVLCGNGNDVKQVHKIKQLMLQKFKQRLMPIVTMLEFHNKRDDLASLGGGVTLFGRQ